MCEFYGSVVAGFLMMADISLRNGPYEWQSRTILLFDTCTYDITIFLHTLKGEQNEIVHAYFIQYISFSFIK